MHLLSSVNFVHVWVQVWQTCSSRLEIKTLCGTWLMIRWELKQKADESSEKKRTRERRRRKRQMVWAVREDACCLWGEGVRNCLCCSPQACVEAAVLSRCQTDLSHWLASVSSFPKCDTIGEIGHKKTCDGHLEELLWWAADVHREGCVQTQTH